MDDLRTLPKQYAELIFFKILLAVIMITSVVLLSVGGVGAFLYLEDYPAHTIIIFALMTWIMFLLLLVAGFYYKLKRFNQSKDQLLDLAHKEAVTFIALHSVNLMLRKWRKTQ